MPRLHLKRTQAEEDERAQRKARKAARKEREAAQTRRSWYGDDEDVARERHRSRSASPKRSGRPRYSYQEQYPGDPGPSSPRYGANADADAGPGLREDEDVDEAARARAEQERFDEKMRDALEDDGLLDPLQRLDGVEARLNTYAHIPRRWRGTDEGFSTGLWMEDAREDIGLEPWQMNDDEYSEYIRAGMWRKKNQAEFQERLRKKEERERRKERERRLREESRRLEEEAQAELERLSATKAKRRLEDARKRYEERWAKLLERLPEGQSVPHAALLRFEDIPWPVAPPAQKHVALTVDDFTKDAVSAFLIPTKDPSADGALVVKDVLRSTLLKFHPDKFESRVQVRVREKDKEAVKEVAGIVVRILNELSKEYR
ncbi:hypothetical protein M0805_009864 [Coniferiporia weirii]|nr:hypothetical protein M0805_009864 [Coniferiporia weirii]